MECAERLVAWIVGNRKIRRIIADELAVRFARAIHDNDERATFMDSTMQQSVIRLWKVRFGGLGRKGIGEFLVGRL